MRVEMSFPSTRWVLGNDPQFLRFVAGVFLPTKSSTQTITCFMNPEFIYSCISKA